jgi:hypothetical protein
VQELQPKIKFCKVPGTIQLQDPGEEYMDKENIGESYSERLQAFFYFAAVDSQGKTHKNNLHVPWIIWQSQADFYSEVSPLR